MAYVFSFLKKIKNKFMIFLIGNKERNVKYKEIYGKNRVFIIIYNVMGSFYIFTI